MTPWSTRAQLILKIPGFAGLLGAALVVGLGASFVHPFLSLWGTERVGMSPAGFGMFMTATTLSAILIATTLARWSDSHLPRKTMLLLAGAAGVVGYVAYGLITTPWVLALIGCTVLALASLSFSQLFAYTREHYYDRAIPGVPPGFLMSVVRVCFSIAWTAGPSLAAWMLVGFGFNGVFLGAAALYLVFVLGVMKYVPYEPRAEHVRAAIREPVWRVLTRGDILAAFVGFLCIFAAHTMNLMNLPLMITRVLGGTGTDVGIAFGVGPAVEIPLMLWFGHLAAQGHGLRLIRFGGVATVVYFLLLNQAEAPWHIFVLQAFHGLSFAIISNVGILFFQDLIPGQPGLATTVFSNAANAGNLLGFFAFGSLVTPVGNRGLFLVSAALTLVMAVVMFVYRPRRAEVETRDQGRGTRD